MANNTISHGQMEDPMEHFNVTADETTLLKCLQDPKQSSKLKVCKDGIQDQIATLTSYLNTTTDMDTLHEVKTLITSAINLIKAKASTPAVVLPTAKDQPANKNITVQRSFFSTKRKKKPANVRLAKPTAEEKKNICKTLLDRPSNLVLSPLKQSTYSKLNGRE